MKSEIKLDGANGVGADKIKLLQSYLGNSLNISVYNDGTQGKLNDKVLKKPLCTSISCIKLCNLNIKLSLNQLNKTVWS